MISVQFASKNSERSIAGRLLECTGFNLLSDILSPSSVERLGAEGELITRSYAPATVTNAQVQVDKAVVRFRDEPTRTYYVKDYRDFAGVAVFVKWIVTPEQPEWLREIFWNVKEGQWNYEQLFITAGFQVPNRLLKISDSRRCILVFASEYLDGSKTLRSLSGSGKRDCIEHCINALHKLADMGAFPAMLRGEELIHSGIGDSVLITDTSVGIWPVFRCFLPLMLGMLDADVLHRLPIDSILTDGYFGQISWKAETEALRGFLHGLSRFERGAVFHQAIDAWKRNSFADKWSTAEVVLAQEEAFLLRNFPSSEAAKKLRAGQHLPL